jgi:death-on-curing protein
VTRYVTLAEYFWLAEQVTGVDADTLAKASRSDLADSALHSPQAGFGDIEFYPDLYDKAAVLVCRRDFFRGRRPAVGCGAASRHRPTAGRGVVAESGRLGEVGSIGSPRAVM